MNDELRADWDGPLRSAIVQAIEEHAEMWGSDATPQGYADNILSRLELVDLRVKARDANDYRHQRDALRAELAALRAKADAADRVRELHHLCGTVADGYCDECDLIWPCLTINALDGGQS